MNAKDYSLVNYRFIPSADLVMKFDDEARNVRGGVYSLYKMTVYNHILDTIQNDNMWDPTSREFQQVLQAMLSY